MINTLEQFGRNAGKLWKTLNEKGSLKEDDLIEITSLRSYEFHIAVGWLAKENKIRKEGDFYKLDQTNLNIKIGDIAGKIYNTLYSAGEIDIYKISKLLKIKEKETYFAIGWLLRENKIYLKMGEIQNQIKTVLEKS